MGHSSRSQLASIILAHTLPVRASSAPRLMPPVVEGTKEDAEGKKDGFARPLTGPPSQRAEKMGQVVASLEVRQGPRRGHYQRVKIGVKARGRILLIDPGDVAAVEAHGNYSLLRSQSSSYLLRASISVLAEQLEPLGFVQVHRSVLINASWVEELRPRVTGEYTLMIKGGREYAVSRTYRRNLNKLAHAWIGTDFGRGRALV